ncbi:MAG: FixG Ig-like domain-containing protein, partial [Bacteroidota bacterium]
TAVLAIIIGVLIYLFAARSDVETTILRAPGTLYIEPSPGLARNLFTIRVVNKTRVKLPIRLVLLEPVGTLAMVGGAAVTVEPTSLAEAAFFIDIAGDNLEGLTTPIRIGVYSGERLIEEVNTGFMGPTK